VLSYLQSQPRAMTDTFRIIWETPSGQFGFATFEECDGLDDAVNFFHSEKAAGVFPADANLEQITPVVASR
jgi:hypothetical protein